MPGVLDGEENWYDLDSNYSDVELKCLQEDMSRRREMKGEGPRSQYPNGYGPDQQHDVTDGPVHMLEHLATFSVGPQYGLINPKDGLRRLLHMEKTSGIWTQKMQMRLDSNWVIIIDYENGDVVEKFPMNLISEPTAYTSDDPREIYNNILIFIVREDPKAKNHSPSEMHIFQCVRIYAQDIVDEMKMFMSGKAKGKYSDLRHLPPPPNAPPPEPPVNGRSSSVREQSGMFNSQYSHHRDSSGSQHRLDRSERASFTRESNDETSSTTSDKYEREVAILNHCFDDIERFIARLQHAAAAYKELERRQKNRKNKKKDMGDGMLSIRAKPPPEREFVDILQKFKFSFNLLAKLKSHIHDPNAPELVHFLFTPLALIVDAARDASHGSNLTARVVTPLLTRDAVELLTNCCTSKETDLWHSLGDAWVIPRDEWKDYEGPYNPVFASGWAPDNPLEDRIEDSMARRLHRDEIRRVQEEQEYQRVFNHPERDICYGSEFGSEGGDRDHSEVLGSLSDPSSRRPPYKSLQSDLSRSEMQRGGTLSPSSERDFHDPHDRDEVSSDSTERADLHLDPQRQFERHQLQWLEELKSRDAKIAQVVYPRSANNEKELTVMRGEFLEVLDDSRKWWKARNMRGDVAHVPHTIVAPYPGGVLDEDVFNNPLYATRGSSRDSCYGPGESLKDGSPGASHDAPRPPPIPPPAPAPADWVRRERQEEAQEVEQGLFFIANLGDIPPAPQFPPPPPPNFTLPAKNSNQSYAETPSSGPPPPPLPPLFPAAQSSLRSTNSGSISSPHRKSTPHVSKIFSQSLPPDKGRPVSVFEAAAAVGKEWGSLRHPPVKDMSTQLQHSASEDLPRKSSSKNGPSAPLQDSSPELNKQSVKSKEVEKSPETAHLELQQELQKLADTLQNSPQIRRKKDACSIHKDGSCSKISPWSSDKEVNHWLDVKKFSSRTQQILSNVTGEQLFKMTKEMLEEHLGAEEGARLHSHLQILKNLLGYKTYSSRELTSVLAKRRQQVEKQAAENSDNLKSDC